MCVLCFSDNMNNNDINKYVIIYFFIFLSTNIRFDL